MRKMRPSREIPSEGQGMVWTRLSGPHFLRCWFLSTWAVIFPTLGHVITLIYLLAREFESLGVQGGAVPLYWLYMRKTELQFARFSQPPYGVLHHEETEKVMGAKRMRGNWGHVCKGVTRWSPHQWERITAVFYIITFKGWFSFQRQFENFNIRLFWCVWLPPYNSTASLCCLSICVGDMGFLRVTDLI